jgi:hypothetical protein
LRRYFEKEHNLSAAAKESEDKPAISKRNKDIAKLIELRQKH